MYFVLQAVCCSDKLHCCPNGYTCDVAAGRCLKGDEFLALFTKQPSKPQVNDVTCPDESTCPTGQTCCQNQQGGYSCCPLPSVSHLLYFFTLNKLQHVVTKNASHLLQSFCSKKISVFPKCKLYCRFIFIEIIFLIKLIPKNHEILLCLWAENKMNTTTSIVLLYLITKQQNYKHTHTFGSTSV